jgi:hypothetical protein
VDDALAASDPERAHQAMVAIEELTADPARWERLVADGGEDVATLLDRAQAALGGADDATHRAGPVVEPWLEGATVEGEVLPALARWAWPLLAADVGEGEARDVAARVLARADEGDDERDAVGGAVALARIHRAITSPAADDEAITAWRSDLAGTALQGLDGDPDDRTSALVDSRFQDLPVTVALAALTAWGDREGVSAPVRGALAEGSTEGSVGAGSVLTVACYLAVIDDQADDAAARVAATLAEEAEDLVALEDALLSSDDRALVRVGDPATLLLSA